ncbi:hypothetical protein [Flavobacterium aciduliphilum]|nr:hypothetical protein [Flavobacterium aciduliphilum]
MIMKIYNKTNFHKHTFCVFQEVDFSEISNLRLGFKSKSGSSYYFVENGVYRESNHWGRAANCKWRLQKNNNVTNQIGKRTKLGFAKWTDFYNDNDVDRLYFIEVDFGNRHVTFNHKESSNYSKEKVLRNEPDTTKIIKQIRVLFDEYSWAKHFKEEDIDSLRKEIIFKLVHTNATFQEIRKEYLHDGK